jgi:hypothetical protein
LTTDPPGRVGWNTYQAVFGSEFGG